MCASKRYSTVDLFVIIITYDILSPHRVYVPLLEESIPMVEKSTSTLESSGSNNDVQSTETRLLKLRVQNICCGKEAMLVKNTLQDLNGIVSVNVNVIGRIAYIKHIPSSITVSEIIEMLNKLHLGISLMESGQNTAAQDNAKAKRWIILRAISLTVQAFTFIAVIVANVRMYKWTRWVAIPVLVLGAIPMVYRAYIDVRRMLFANINLLMLIAMAGTVALQDWLDACLIVFVFNIAEILLQICYYKAEKGLSG